MSEEWCWAQVARSIQSTLGQVEDMYYNPFRQRKSRELTCNLTCEHVFSHQNSCGMTQSQIYGKLDGNRPHSCSTYTPTSLPLPICTSASVGHHPGPAQLFKPNPSRPSLGLRRRYIPFYFSVGSDVGCKSPGTLN